MLCYHENNIFHRVIASDNLISNERVLIYYASKFCYNEWILKKRVYTMYFIKDFPTFQTMLTFCVHSCDTLSSYLVVIIRADSSKYMWYKNATTFFYFKRFDKFWNHFYTLQLQPLNMGLRALMLTIIIMKIMIIYMKISSP